MSDVPDRTTVDELSGDEDSWRIDVAEVVPADRADRVSKALDLLIDGELKLLAIYDQRQANADTRTTALASAAIALPTLILGLSKSFASNALLLKVGYVTIIVLAFFVFAARSWNAWGRRRDRAAIAFGIALIVSAGLVWHARFTS
jgi:hypothetical protein